MENLTIGQISAGMIFIVAFITAVHNIKKTISAWVENSLKPRFDSIDKSQEKILKRIDEVDERLDKVDLDNCKNYLVTFLAEVRRDEPKDSTEYQRFWESYDHYILKGGNSYIKEDVENLKLKGQLRR